MEGSLLETTNPKSETPTEEYDNEKNDESEFQMHMIRNSDICHVAELALGKVDHQKYGRAEIEAIFPLMSKPSYPNLEKIPVLRKYFGDLLYTGGIVWGNEELKCVDYGVIFAVYNMPGHNLDSLEVEAVSALCIASYYLDDLMDQGFFRDGIQNSAQIGTIIETLCQATIMDTEFGVADALSKFVPAIHPAVLLVSHAAQLMRSVLNGCDLKTNYPMESLKNTLMSQNLLNDTTLNKALSIHGFISLRRYDVAIEPILELIAVMSSVHLNQKIRESVLFQITMDIFYRSCAYANDMTGIRRDITNEDGNNIILRNVQDGKVTLVDAFQRHNKELVVLVNDFLVFTEKLCSDNPDNEALEAYFDIAKSIYTHLIVSVDQASIRERYMTGNADLVFRELDTSSPYGI